MVALSDTDNWTVENTAKNCLKLFPIVSEHGSECGGGGKGEKSVYRCKTCMREFSSFQALGGHRASHKKSITNGYDQLLSSGSGPSTKKSKTTTLHICPICGVEFSMGQALGGHMRKHRNEKDSGALVTLSLFPDATMKKSSSRKRVLCLDSKENLNLNLELGMSIY